VNWAFSRETTQVRLQDEQTAMLLRERPESPDGLALKLMSLNGCYIKVVEGE